LVIGRGEQAIRRSNQAGIGLTRAGPKAWRTRSPLRGQHSWVQWWTACFPF